MVTVQFDFTSKSFFHELTLPFIEDFLVRSPIFPVAGFSANLKEISKLGHYPAARGGSSFGLPSIYPGGIRSQKLKPTITPQHVKKGH